MFEHRRVGELVGANPVRKLLLPHDRPLSYLRVEGSGDDPAPSHWTATLARTLLEHRAMEFRRRIPLGCFGGLGREEISAALARFRVSPVYPVLAGDGESASEICWLDSVQMLALGRHLSCGFAASERTVTVAGLEISPVYETGPAATVAPTQLTDWQYWNSNWGFATAPGGSSQWWRVRPNQRRDRHRHLGLLPNSEARGTSAACLHPELLESLGTPRYLVIEHPFRAGARVPVLALADSGLERLPRAEWERALFLDRTARDVLGVSDGEFCLAHAWLRPRRKVLGRHLRDRYIGSRTVSANVRTSARADLEKPVCRLGNEALASIGGEPNEFVTIEALAGDGSEWRLERISQRVLPIDDGERVARGSWETAQTWDHRSIGGGDDPVEADFEREGFVDCAETLGVQPPYPTVYLNFYARRELGVGLCHPVEVRVSVLNRLGSELGNLAWLVLIGLIGTVAALLRPSVALIAAILGGTLLVLLAIRTMRTTR